METNMKTITINGVEYVEKSSVQDKKEIDENFFIVRTYAAGVFFGNIASKDLITRSVVMNNARRVWYWSGAASLSQLAVDGTCKPSECKFPCAVDGVTLMQVEEIIPMTKEAVKSLQGVAVWKQTK